MGDRKRKVEGFGQRFAKEVGMGDPAEENDPPPESALSMTKNGEVVNPKIKESPWLGQGKFPLLKS